MKLPGLLAAAALAAAFLLVEPIAQDPSYHAFADTRRLFGIPNFWNVASNLPFLVTGAWGMAFATIVVGEYVSTSLARKLLTPLLGIGVAAVLYWLHTEALGAGDLRPYALVQFVPLAATPVLVTLRRARSRLSPYIAGLIGAYVLAKLAEHFDAQLLQLTGSVSGHAAKHVLAALGAACLLAGLAARRDGR